MPQLRTKRGTPEKDLRQAATLPESAADRFPGAVEGFDDEFGLWSNESIMRAEKHILS